MRLIHVLFVLLEKGGNWSVDDAGDEGCVYGMKRMIPVRVLMLKMIERTRRLIVI